MAEIKEKQTETEIEKLKKANLELTDKVNQLRAIISDLEVKVNEGTLLAEILKRDVDTYRNAYVKLYAQNNQNGGK